MGDLMVSATWRRLVFWYPTVPLSLGLNHPEPADLIPRFRGVDNGRQVRFDAEDRYLSRISWLTQRAQLEIDAVSSAPEVRSVRSPPEFNFLRFALNAEGTLAALALSNAVQILDVETGVELARLPLTGAREPLFLPAQAGLVATSEQGLFTWPFTPGSGGEELLVGPRRLITGSEGRTQARLGPKGLRLALWQDDHAQIYSLPDLRPISQTGKHGGGAVLGPSFSADEELLAVACWNSLGVSIWNIATSNLAHRISLTNSRGPTTGRAEFTPDGKWLFATTLEDLRLYEPGSWSLHASIPWKSRGSQQAFLANGKIVAVVSDKTAVAVHLLKLPEFKELAVLETANNKTIAHLGFSGNGLKLFAVREDGEVEIWNLPLIAAGLAELGLAWDAPLPQAGALKRGTPPLVRIHPSDEGEVSPTPDGLVSWWPAEGDAADRVGTNHGTLVNGVGFTAGQVKRAFNFASGDQEVRIPASASLDVGAGPGFTIEGWIKPSDAWYEYPLAEWNSGSSVGAHLWISVIYTGYGGLGSIYASLTGVRDGIFATGPGVIQPGVWQHVAMTYDKSSGIGRLYRNGIEVTNRNLGFQRPQTTFDLLLGSRPGVSTYTGSLDEFSLYSRALTAAELLAIYGAGSAGKCLP
jgi:hypothetical protein